MNILTMLSYPPILRGLIALIASAVAFPIVGVWLIRLNLLPYRFMLMHGAMLGGALGFVLGHSPLLMVIVVNILLIFIVDLMSNRGRMDAGLSSMFLMVASLGAAMALIYGADVPAQDALTLLWGNIFAVSVTETAFTVLFCFLLLLTARIYFLPITAVIFNRDIAFSAGVNDLLVLRFLLVLTGFTVAFAMRILGALLMDALLLLPAMIASLSARSLAGFYRRSILIGLFIGSTGFTLALVTNLPVGAATALLGAGTLGLTQIVKTIFLKRRNYEKIS